MIRNSGGLNKGSFRTPEKCENWSHYQTVWERICWNLLWKQTIMYRKLNISTQLSCVSSGTIYMRVHLRSKGLLLTPALKKSDRQEQSVSSSGTPRTGTKTPSSWMRKFSSSRSSRTTSTTRCMFKHPLRCVLRVQEAITLPTSWIGGGVSHQGMTNLHFCKKGVKTGAWVYPEDVLQGVVKHLNTTVRNGSSRRTQLLPTRPRRLRSVCGGKFRALSTPRIGPWGVQTSTPGTINCGLFWEDVACQKRHNNLDSLKRSLVKQRQRSPPEMVRAVTAEWPECLKALRRGTGWPFWVIL